MGTDILPVPSLWLPPTEFSNGVHPYFGGGAMASGVSSSICWSPQDSSPDCRSGQAGGEVGPFFGAAGYGGGSGFWEAGVGWG
jgi:hypothetical protein